MRHLGSLYLLSGIALGASAGALAQGAAADELELAEVVVTAEFRVVDIQKTPINLTVVTQEELLEKGVVDTRTMLDQIPGLDMTNANPNNYIGLYGTASAGGSMWSDSNMTFNYGGIPLARSVVQASAFYDLERVEVLKGPQGTLYGRNATVGSLNIVTAKPTNEFGGNVNVTVGNYSTVNTQGALNLPMSERVSARVAFQTSRHDGYFTNGYDDANNFGARGSLLFKPSDNLSVLLWADTFKNRSKGPTTTFRYYFPGQEWIDPSNPWFGLGPANSCSNQVLCPSFLRITAGGVNTQAAFTNGVTGGPDVSGFSDTSPTGLANYSVFGADAKSHSGQNMYVAQVDWTSAVGTLTTVAARVDTTVDYDSYTNGLKFGNDTDAYQDSLEMRLASSDEDRFRWLLGGFYYKEHQDAFQYNMQSTGFALLYTPNLVNTSYAAFADGTFDVTDSFRFSAGVRYTKETKTQDGYVTQTGVLASSFAPFAAIGIQCFTASIAAKVNFRGFWMPNNFCVIPNGGKYDDDNVSGKVGFEWDVAEQSMLYLTLKNGFRAGGFTAGTETTYKPEILTAYELGSRNRFAGDRVQLNASAFYWDYEDQQLSQLQAYIVNGTLCSGCQTSYPFNVNGDLYGLETDLQMLVGDNGTFHANLLYTKGQLDSTPNLVNSAGVTGPLFNVDRYNLPEWTVNAGYDHRVPMANGGSINLGADAHYEGSAVIQLADPVLLVPGARRDSFVKWNANVTYHSPDDKWSLMAYVLNATNEAVPGVGSSGQVAAGTFYKPNTTGTATAAQIAAQRSATLDPPRTFGLRFNVSF